MSQSNEIRLFIRFEASGKVIISAPKFLRQIHPRPLEEVEVNLSSPRMSSSLFYGFPIGGEWNRFRAPDRCHYQHIKAIPSRTEVYDVRNLLPRFVRRTNWFSLERWPSSIHSNYASKRSALIWHSGRGRDTFSALQLVQSLGRILASFFF